MGGEGGGAASQRFLASWMIQAASGINVMFYSWTFYFFLVCVCERERAIRPAWNV